MKLILLIIVVVAVVYAFRRYSTKPSAKSAAVTSSRFKYQYRRKDFIMTKAENDFFNTLVRILGSEYYVFPQVHLSAILDHKVAHQNWKASFTHINQKSVDYVICSRQYRRPVLAIELDDWSHDSDSRKLRDEEVDRIFNDSGLPLLRLRDVKSINTDTLRTNIYELLS